MKDGEFFFDFFVGTFIFLVLFSIRTARHICALIEGATAKGGKGFVGAKYVDGFPVSNPFRHCYFCGANYREIEYCSIQIPYEKILERKFPPLGVNLPVKILKKGIFVKQFGGKRFAVCTGCGGIKRLDVQTNGGYHFRWNEITPEGLEQYLQSRKIVLNTKNSRFKYNDYSGYGNLEETSELWN